MASTSESRDLRFLDPAALARLGTMELKARTVVEGFLAGLHRSPFKGFSVEFAEYRQYLPGDDLSRLDWKVYARSDRHYVKKFEEETNLDCHLLLDVSASMAYRGGAPMSKMEYASVLAASLAFLMNRQRDATGLMAFDHRIVSRLPPGARPGHLHALLLALEALRPGERSDLGRPLRQLATAVLKRSLVVFISDLLHDPEPVISGLRHLKARRCTSSSLVLDPNGLTFPQGPSRSGSRERRRKSPGRSINPGSLLPSARGPDAPVRSGLRHSIDYGRYLPATDFALLACFGAEPLK